MLVVTEKLDSSFFATAASSANATDDTANALKTASDINDLRMVFLLD
jgi:hypothetical protein